MKDVLGFEFYEGLSILQDDSPEAQFIINETSSGRKSEYEFTEKRIVRVTELDDNAYEITVCCF